MKTNQQYTLIVTISIIKLSVTYIAMGVYKRKWITIVTVLFKVILLIILSKCITKATINKINLMFKFLYGKENTTYKGFNKLINNTRFIFKDLIEVLYFEQYDKLLYFCILRNPTAFTFSHLGEEIVVGEEKFCLIADYTGITKKAMIIGHKTGDRYFLYAFITEYTKGYALGFPMFFCKELNGFFTPLLDKGADNILDYQGCFTNRGVETSLLVPSVGEKHGVIEVEKTLINYSIPIYEHAAPIYLVKSNGFKRVDAINQGYDGEMVNTPKGDQGKEIMGIENTETARGALKP